MRVNGAERQAPGSARRLLSDYLRGDLGLTGTHVGCEHGVCGCCTVLLDGRAIRSCLMLAVQAEGHEVTTIESLSPEGAGLHPVQRAFQECHGLQCGFCTPGFVMAICGLLAQTPDPDPQQIEEGIAGNLCRCTGYASIRRAVRRAAELMQEPPSPGFAGYSPDCAGESHAVAPSPGFAGYSPDCAGESCAVAPSPGFAGYSPDCAGES
ncbi:MAG TPA: (2Fe-2S)-binding protein [Candidatus Dormibacteraeota bacterium]|nr:(2Fe-2S)-binding protein [Candidatus Dormibacteraeota bacterium]